MHIQRPQNVKTHTCNVYPYILSINACWLTVCSPRETEFSLSIPIDLISTPYLYIPRSYHPLLISHGRRVVAWIGRVSEISMNPLCTRQSSKATKCCGSKMFWIQQIIKYSHPVVDWPCSEVSGYLQIIN